MDLGYRGLTPYSLRSIFRTRYCSSLFLSTAGARSNATVFSTGSLLPRVGRTIVQWSQIRFSDSEPRVVGSYCMVVVSSLMEACKSRQRLLGDGLFGATTLWRYTNLFTINVIIIISGLR